MLCMNSEKGELNMTDIRYVAQYFLSKESISHKKLQKLCYYAQAWYLANHGQPMVSNRFEAWVHGPVSPDLYAQYKKWGWALIPQMPENKGCFTEVEIDLMDKVYDVYGNYTGDELEALTHREAPWKSARMGYSPSEYCRNPISMKEMKDYYGERIGKKYA